MGRILARMRAEMRANWRRVGVDNGLQPGQDGCSRWWTRGHACAGEKRGETVLRFVDESLGSENATDVPFDVAYTHRLRTTRGVFQTDNDTLADLLESTAGGPARVLVLADDGVTKAWPGLEGDVARYVEARPEAMELAGPVMTLPGGEVAKNDPRVLSDVLRAIERAGLCRRSYVVAVGGGAVLDVAGYAAAIVHRGLRLVRVPTTTLAQGDSGVGVKNGVNAFGKKNFLGTFAPAWGIINDGAFLSTLSDRDWRCGFSEAVKVALVKDAAYFDRIESCIEALSNRDDVIGDEIIARSAELHVRHITEGGDAFETTAARPLDFGHWSAHKLEQLTGYAMRHGEGVAIGIGLDTAYSALKGMISESDAERVLACLEGLGFAMYHPTLEDESLLAGLEEFREHLGGELTIALLGGIGRGVDVHEVDADVMRQAIDRLRQTR